MTERQREINEKLKLQKSFGLHLKKLRASKGLTAAELSRLCFMERSNIARLEMGRMNPSLFVLKKLADGLEIDIQELFKGFK